jgi:tRNA 2-selenouridine synthase
VKPAAEPAARDRKVGVDALPRYPERIDVRSPAEFALDHLPGAVNHPVLGNEERARIGLMHAQLGGFAAKRAGAALVARNIATMLETALADKPREWAPLVYCWRGGKRSGALAHILNEIGWRAVQLDGGYRSYRRHVVAQLAAIPAALRFEVICGLTGSGKSRLLAALAAEGAQTLDLEGMAKHRGSLLGDLPGDPQPSQKAFESGVLAALQACDPRRPVYVESESRKIGTVQVPDALLDAMRASPCIRVETARAIRVELLKEEYAHFLADHGALTVRLAQLVELHGRKRLDRWAAAAAAGAWDELVGELLAEHYDPMYLRSIGRNFPRAGEALVVSPAAADIGAFRALARELDARVSRRHAATTVTASAAGPPQGARPLRHGGVAKPA